MRPNNLKIIYIILFILFLINTSCSAKIKTDVDKKNYDLIMFQSKHHSSLFEKTDDEDENNRKLLENNEIHLETTIGILTNDSVYIFTNFDYPNNINSDLYSLHKKNKSLILYHEQNQNLDDSLVINLNEKEHTLTINNNEYTLNENYFRYIQKECFEKRSIFPLFPFINPYTSDFYNFYPLTKYRWNDDILGDDCKVLKAKIRTINPQDSDITYNWTVSYSYINNNLSEIIKSKDGDEYYHLKLADNNSKSKGYKYTYIDDLERFFEMGYEFRDENLNDSVFYSRENYQRRQIDEGYIKTIDKKTYPLTKLNLSPEEIFNLIKPDLYISKEN